MRNFEVTKIKKGKTEIKFSQRKPKKLKEKNPKMGKE